MICKETYLDKYSHQVVASDEVVSFVHVGPGLDLEPVVVSGPGADHDHVVPGLVAGVPVNAVAPPAPPLAVKWR